ncbi:molybdopterin-dependent oxidoreductase, partial [Salmonella enterica]
KTSAIGSLALASSAFTLPFSRIAHAAADLASGNVAEKAVWSSCTVNCGSRCLLRLHVKDDTVYWVESDTTGNDEYGNHQVRACLRGRSIRRRMNHPDRLKYPMKRVGKRGEGKFERISWDEALDTIGDNLKRILKDYGNEAVHVLYGTGVDGGNITNSNVPYRLMNACGGYLSRYGSYSTAQISAAMSYMFGGNDGNSPDDIANTKLVVMFGNNPAETRMSGGGVTYYVEQARERSNARMI